MAGIQPTFLTGATAKIKLNGKTLAFCTDITCAVDILTQTPKVLGMYEGSSVEPLGYLVSGSFSIVRYVKGIKEATGNPPNGLAGNDAGNGVGNWGTQWGGKFGDLLARNGFGNDGRAHEALDPSKFNNGTTFDIQIYQKVDKRTGTVPQQSAIDATLSAVSNVLQGGTNSGPGNSGPNIDFLGVLNIRNARLTRAEFSLSKKSVAVERYNFVALYVDGDGFVANASGQGQQF